MTAWSSTPDEAADSTKSDEDAATKPERRKPAPLFRSLEAWVSGWFAPIYVRRSSRDFRWCPEWWQHAEVISRLQCLWETWEVARLEGGGAMSGWWHDVEQHMAVITADGGPFGECTSSDGHKGSGDGLRILPAPPGTWGPTAT